MGVHKMEVSCMYITFKKIKLFVLFLNQVELTVFTLYISATKIFLQSVVYFYQKVVKYSQFIFSHLTISF